MLQGIFFDLDDTLIDSTGALQEAMHQTAILAQRVLPTVTTSSLLAAMIAAYQETFGYGKPGYAGLATLPTETLRYRLAELSLARLGTKLAKTAILELAQCYSQAEATYLRALPDTYSLLETLQPHFHLGIITNGPGPLQREKLAKLQLLPYFNTIVIDSEFGHPKPDKRIFAHAAKQAGLSEGELLFVGNDADADIAGAKGAGWSSVHINSIGGSVADYTISSIKYLLTLPPVHKNLVLATRTNLADTMEKG